MATNNTSSVRVPRRAEGIRIALALATTQQGVMSTSCTSADELRPTFSIRGVRYDGPVAALRQLGKCVRVGKSERLYPTDNEAACKVDSILGITDTFIKCYVSCAAEITRDEQEHLAPALQGPFETLVRTIYPGTHQAEGDCFCVGGSLTIADLQVYALFAILDTVPVHEFSAAPCDYDGRTSAAILHCRKIASNKMIQAGKQYYLDNGSDI